ncbi:MAG: type II secretion system F family protein [Candidatus Margulisiibacteriota bacterium]|jgi:tight adherence protein B
MLIILALIFLSVTLLSITFSISVRGEELKKQEELKNRLRYLGKQKATVEAKAEAKSGLSFGSTANLFKLFIPQNMRAWIEEQLQQAHLPLNVNEFFSVSIIFVAGCSIFGLVIGRDISVAFLFMLIGVMLPYFFLKNAVKAKIKKFDSMLADTITMVANTLKGGFGLRQGLQVVSEEMPSPVSNEFKTVLQEIAWGLTLEEALNNLAKRVPSEDLDLLITSINIQSEIGGNLSEILEKITETIRDRRKIKGEINSLTAQGKVSGAIVGALPVFIGGIIFTVNPKYMLNLFINPMGLLLLGIAVFMEITGALIIKKIITLDV